MWKRKLKQYHRVVMILSGFQPVSALKGKLPNQTIGGFNTRRVLIVGQFVISQVLIIGMIVIMDQMRFAQQADLGFEKDAIVMINVGTDSTGTKSAVIKNEISRPHFGTKENKPPLSFCLRDSVLVRT